LLHNRDETAERLGVESGDDGDSRSLGKDDFEVGLGGDDRWDRIGDDGDREDVVVGGGGRTIGGGDGLEPKGLVEVCSEGVERELAMAATELGLSPNRQAACCAVGGAVETLARVGGMAGEVNADRGAQSEHGRSSTTAMRRRSVWGSNPQVTAIRRPLERMSSRWDWEAGIDRIGSARMVTGRKWWSALAAERSSLGAGSDGRGR
jgi:hypothetical protein